MHDIIWVVLLVAVGAVALILIVWTVQLVGHLTNRKKGSSRPKESN